MRRFWSCSVDTSVPAFGLQHSSTLTAFSDVSSTVSALLRGADTTHPSVTPCVSRLDGVLIPCVSRLDGTLTPCVSI